MKRPVAIVPVLRALLAAAPQAFPAPATTRIEVGVLANGAKFIGDSTGGAAIRIVDTATGEVLAEGVTRGGTGDTSVLMGKQGGIYKPLAGEGDAVFVADLALHEPRRVTIAATGPLDFPAARATASESVWLVPGKDLSGGSRVILALNGYLIEPVKTDIDATGTGSVEVSLRMLCGCPVRPGGTWDAKRIIKRATLVGANGEAQSVALAYSGEGTLFGARFDGRVTRPRGVRIDMAGMDDSNVASRWLPLDD